MQIIKYCVHNHTSSYIMKTHTFVLHSSALVNSMLRGSQAIKIQDLRGLRDHCSEKSFIELRYALLVHSQPGEHAL